MKFSHAKLIVISGTLWLAIGVYLLIIGTKLLFGPFHIAEYLSTANMPLINLLSPYVGNEEITAILLTIVALYVGYMKGRFVLAKSAIRNIAHIRTMPNPSSLASIYSWKYYLLLGSMVILGISIKYMGLNPDIRGLIDMTIGSALVNGAMTYYRGACEKNSECGLS